MVTKKTWEEFRATGLLWWINMILHTFGWAIVVNIGDGGDVIEAYPARVKFRGFDPELNTEGYVKVSSYMREEIESLHKEAQS
jgi:hypothetical protein